MRQEGCEGGCTRVRYGLRKYRQEVAFLHGHPHSIGVKSHTTRMEQKGWENKEDKITLSRRGVRRRAH
jgi:hypothetical protein